MPNLEKAISQFTALGFTVKLGGEHAYTHNALIIFNDGAYVELLSLKPSWYRWLMISIAKSGLLGLIADGKSDISWRVMRWIGYKYGPIDWALRTDNIETTMLRLDETNVMSLDALGYQRTRADGKIVHWTMAGAKDLDLPFLIEDQTDFNLRVPHGSHTSHANGALGIKKIIVSARNTGLAKSNLGSLISISDSHSRVENSELKPELKLQETTIEYKELDDSEGKFVLELCYQGNESILLDCGHTSNTKIWLVPTD